MIIECLKTVGPKIIFQKAFSYIPWSGCCTRVCWMLPCCSCAKLQTAGLYVDRVKSMQFGNLLVDMIGNNTGKETVYFFKKKWMQKGKTSSIVKIGGKTSDPNARKELINAKDNPEIRKKVAEKLRQENAEGETVKVVEIKVKEQVVGSETDEEDSGEPGKREANVSIESRRAAVYQSESSEVVVEQPSSRH